MTAADEPRGASHVRIRRATRDDDAALVQLMRDVPMEGALTLAQDRAPSFFAMGDLHDGTFEPWVAEDVDGRIVGAGTIVVRDGWHPGGVLKPVVYICDLRVLPAWRKARVIPRLGRAALEHARDAHGCDVAFTAVMDDNRRVVGTATSRASHRAQQPISRPMCRYTMANVQWIRGAKDRAEEAEDVDELAAFLDDRQRARLFGRRIEAKRLEALRAQGVRALVVRREGRIVGACAPWDLHEAKRMRVLGYGPTLRAYKRMWDLAAPVLRRPRLPDAGDALRYTTLSHLEIDGDDPKVARMLLESAYLRARDAHFVSMMVPRGSRLADGLRGTWVHPSPMTLYVTTLPESAWATNDPTSSRPGFEMALA